MKRKRFTEEQIIGILKEWEAGQQLGELSRKYGVSEKSLYLWRRKFGGMEVPDAKRLRALEEENRKLKRIVADLTLDITMLKDVLSKKW